MPDRSLTYKITIDTSQAKAQATSIRALFEAELRQMSVGKLDTSGVQTAIGHVKALSSEFEKAVKSGDMGQLDTSGITRAVAEAGQLASAFEQAATAARNIKPPSVGGGGGDISSVAGQLLPGGIGTLAGAFAGGFAVTGAIAGIKELGQELDALARRGAVFNQIDDVLGDYARSVGSSADAMVSAAQKAAAGTISQFDLILNANRAIQFEVAKTPEAFAKLIELSTALGRAQGISDTQALEFLTTGIARESKLILDNLGLIVDLDDATGKYAATLGKTAGQLTTAERKQALLEEAFRQGAVAIEANREAANSAATQFERLDANTQNLRDSFGRWLSEVSASQIKSIADAIALVNRELFKQGTASGIEEQIDIIKAKRDELATTGQLKPSFWGMTGFYGDAKERTEMLAEYDAQLKDLESQLLKTQVAESAAGISMQQAATLSMQSADAFSQSANALAEFNRQKDAQAKEQFAGQSKDIDKGLLGRAEQSVDVLGADRALEMYKKAKADAEAAIQNLANSGVTDAAEIELRTAEILNGLTAVFDEAEERASQGFAVDFSAIGSAFNSLNQGFVDFLPGIAGAREELAALSEELAYTGSMSAEQAAQFKYLSSVAYAVADGGSQLNGVVNELGTQFLSSNAYAAELVNQLFLAEVAFRNGQISAGTYAGMTAALTGNLLTLAQGAGIATNAIYALNQAQGDMSNLQGFAGGQAVGGSIANRIQTQQAASGREQNRREMERYNAAVARQQETSARRAGKALEDGAKKASDQLKNALDKVPGLFGTTQVTEQDVKDTELGIYQEKADEYLRRLRDEVENGKDWEDVSIEEARAGLERAGLEVGATAEQTLALLERAMNDSSLYSAIENIPIFINEEAVERYKELQKKSEEGRKHVYEFFGVQIDEATEAATSGGGGAAPAPVAPPKLVDIDPLTEGLQTGLDEYVNANGEVIKEQVAQAQALFFDPANLFGTGAKTGGKNVGAMGPAQKPGATITADATLQALTPYITGQQQATVQVQATGAAFGPQPQGATPTTGAVTLTPTLDATTLQAELSKLTLTITPAFVVAEVEKQNIISAVSAITPTANVALAVSAEAGTMTTLVQSLNTELRKIQPDIAREGATVSAMLTGGITASLSSTDTPLSIAQPLSTALITDIATNAALFASPGTIVAQLIMAAMLAAMKGGQQAEGGGEAGGGGSLAMAMVTNLATQFSTNANMFYATGLIPAQNVEAGFKGYQYAGMADSLQAQLTQAIAAKAGEFILTGSYIGGWIQQGINQAFTAEVNMSFAVNAGASWGTAFMKGALNAVGGGTLVQAISDKVITDLATEMEQP